VRGWPHGGRTQSGAPDKAQQQRPIPEVQGSRIGDEEVEDELVVDLAVAAGHLKLIVGIVGLHN
jgi:hypothetical protein